MSAARAGRPQRALSFLGLALALGLAARLPVLMAGANATLAAMHDPKPALPGDAAPILLAASEAPPPPLLARVAEVLPQPRAMQPLLPRRPILAGPALATLTAEIAPLETSVVAAGPAPLPPTPATPTAFDLASSAYARVAANDRRTAVALFDAALAAGPDPRAEQWQRDRNALTRRWSGDAYALARDAGPAGPAASPVLGGGQSGASLAWSIDPLARRPIAIVGRVNAANSDRESTQAAIGLRWRPLKGISLSAERLVAIGADARNDWTLRLAAGAEGRSHGVRWSGYGEAGLLGNGDVYAGGQARALLPLARIGKGDVSAGLGNWASIQTGFITSGRVDIGPSIAARTTIGRIGVDIAADWRFRVAGNAEPGSGPALTLSTSF